MASIGKYINKLNLKGESLVSAVIGQSDYIFRHVEWYQRDEKKGRGKESPWKSDGMF